VPKDTHRTATTDRAQLVLPGQVTVAVAELAQAAREGLLALAVGTGLQVLQAMLAEDVARLVGPRGRHNPARTAVRHGTEPGQVTLGGRRVRVRRPRVRAADGTWELPMPTYQAFTATPSPPPTCSASSRWSACSPSCRRAAIGLVCFACRVVGGELATSDESLEVGFFTPAEIETMPMHESTRLRIRHYLEHRPQPVIA
jgi:hypothetical protein